MMLGPVFDPLLNLVREHGPLLLFLAAFLENAAFLSWLVPGEKMVAVGGYFVQRGELRFELAWLCVFAGVFLGDHVGYFIGRYGGKYVLHRLPYEKVVTRISVLIHRYGGWVVLFGRFTGIGRPTVLFTVGMMRLPYRKFWLFELVGAASWSLVWLGIGVLGGSLFDYLGEFGPWVPWLALGGVVALGLVIWRFRHKMLRLILGDDEPAERAPQPAS